MTRKSIGFAIKAALILLVAFCLSFYLVFQHFLVTESISFSVPDSSIEIEHARIRTHMLAEYDRWLTVIVDGKPFETRELAYDTCGGYPINCYTLEEDGSSFLHLNDAVSEHLIDLQTGKVHEIHEINDVKYYGVVKNGDVTTAWSAGSVDGVPNPITIRGLPAKLLSELIGEDAGKYIGQIDGRVGKLKFYSSTERPEPAVH